MILFKGKKKMYIYIYENCLEKLNSEQGHFYFSNSSDFLKNNERTSYFISEGQGSLKE